VLRALNTLRPTLTACLYNTLWTVTQWTVSTPNVFLRFEFHFSFSFSYSFGGIFVLVLTFLYVKYGLRHYLYEHVYH